MKLKQIEIRVPEQFNSNCMRVQFYLNAPYKVLYSLEQTDQETDVVTIVGADLLEKEGLTDKDTIHAYILGITEENEPFVFEPYQEVLKITEVNVFRFKNVILK